MKILHKVNLLFGFFFGILLIVIGCKTLNDVRVVETNFDKVAVAEKQNLVFHFNKPLYPDSLLNDKWDTTHYIEFEPKVVGYFKWSKNDELVFSPRKGFEPSTNYKAILTSKLLNKYAGKSSNEKFIDDPILHFNTAALQVTQTGAQWFKSKDNGQVMLQLNLDFNYNIDVTATASKISLTSNGNPVSFSTINSGLGKTVSLQFQPLTSPGQTTDLQVKLNNGVAIAGSKSISSNDTTFQVNVPSRGELVVTGIDAQHDGLQGVIELSLSQPITTENVGKFISIKPAVAFKATTSERGITVTSESFDASESYKITVSKSLTGDFGGKLIADYVSDVKFGTLEPSLAFANTKGMYLSDKGYKNVALNMVKVPKVKVSVVKVYENNILQLFRRGSRYGYEYDEENDSYGGSYDYYETENIGDTVFTKEYDTEKLPSKNAMRFLHLDFSDKLRSYNGVYVVTVASTEQKWVQESKILSLSDIGLIAKQEDNRVLVFANSIKEATPIAGTKITFISTTNQAIYTKETDKEGVAVFDNIENTAPGMRIGMVSAKLGDEYSFLVFNQSQIETSRFDVGGRVSNKTGLNAWIYAERNLYRPGETIHSSVIVRDESWKVPGEMPVKLRLLMPNGKEMAVRKLMLNEQGSTEAAFEIPKSGLTGVYTLQAYSGNDVLLNSYDFNIEDFVPDRIKSTLQLNKQDFGIGETVQSIIRADNLFGTPAANRNVEWELNLDKEAFRPKGYDDYNFNVVKNFDFKSVLRNTKSDNTGLINLGYTIPNDIAATGLLKGNIHSTVFDETGRPVHRFAQFKVWTQPVFVGIKWLNSYVGTRVPLPIHLVAVDNGGKIKSMDASVSIVKKEWQNVIQESGGRYKYVAQWSDRVITTQNVSINGENTVFNFTPKESGEYEVRVAIGKNASYVQQSFYAYGGGDTEYSSFEVNNEGNVTIKANKENYNKGDDIDLLFTTPFEGRMLVSVERNNVLEHYFLQTNNKTACLRVKATDAYLPNVYIAATLFRPMKGDDMPLTVAHGYVNIAVDEKANKLPVNVSMTDKSRSHSKQTIVVNTVPNAYVTIAAVDEGILQVRDYISPNPYDYFYQKVALGVNSYDVYPFLLPEYNVGQSSTGGDGSANQMKSRVNPLFVNRIKNVSFWSGIQKADASGKLNYSIDVPQFSGKLRVMVVAYKNKAFGSYDNGMTIADPIVVSTALPRFLSPSDKAKMPVTLSNTTGKSVTANVEVATEGPLNAGNIHVKSVTIPANSEARVVFDINAESKIGAGKVMVKVSALNEVFDNETEIAVRPSGSLQKQFSSGVLSTGFDGKISFPNNFMPGTLDGTFIVSHSPMVRLTNNLNYLLQYPFGCVEQTVSSVFPQLYYGDLVGALSNKKGNTNEANYNVQQALLKLQAMQLPNGGLSYWPGGNYESWWGSVYAAHFVQEAKKAGFDVNANFNNRLLGYLKTRLKKRETTTLYYNNGQQRIIIAKEVPYSLYVLALAKDAQSSLMNYYKANTDVLSIDGRYLLAGAFRLTGNETSAKQVLPPAFRGEKAYTEFGGSFYSYVRDMGISLNSLVETDPSNAQIGELAKLLTDQMQSQYSLNTQENVFALLALGKIARKSIKEDAQASVYVGQKKTDVTKAPWSIQLPTLGGNELKVNVQKGQFYYFKEVSGISADGSIKEGDHHIQIRRSFYDRNGNIFTGNSFKQNDLVVVKLTLRGETGMQIDNVVITDMLPAGFEIENTRLLDLPNLKWITEKNSDQPDYMDVRDDRMNLFTDIKGDAKNFYYMVRAVSPGVYKLGPAQADAMYNGSYYSAYGSGSITITE
ncbi:MAG: hypothetical protein DI598_01865 [Pseudopedobacter saltans]|uniref:Alpha-2-macroglobulin domain protein n=1 Tax=Pseudopedobacter saltans TaxID=151895 RepID=A0A2W5F7D0_9SPHI|nr:MAG: hypothetical protein DI598_01865 [Pseudopedobacter saltans]